VPRKLVARKTDKVLRGVQPNAGIEAAYRRKMQALITEMDKSVVYWLRAQVVVFLLRALAPAELHHPGEIQPRDRRGWRTLTKQLLDHHKPSPSLRCAPVLPKNRQARRITPVVEDRPQAIKVGLWDTLEEIAALDRQPLAESRRSFACHTGEARAAITSISTCGSAPQAIALPSADTGAELPKHRHWQPSPLCRSDSRPTSHRPK
jgi:hypothetical protein